MRTFACDAAQTQEVRNLGLVVDGEQSLDSLCPLVALWYNMYGLQTARQFSLGAGCEKIFPYGRLAQNFSVRNL